MAEGVPQNKQAFPTVESFAKFLESVPAGQFRTLPNETFKRVTGARFAFEWPSIQLYCANETCDGVRFADTSASSFHLDFSEQANRFATYRCRNCNTHLKVFAIIFFGPSASEPGTVAKIGELPLFGPYVPKNALELLGENVDQFG